MYIILSCLLKEGGSPMNAKVRAVLNGLAKAVRIADLLLACANGVVSTLDTNSKASS
jgi:hypothetical protein